MSVVIASYLPIDKAIYKGYNPIYNWACRWFFTPNSGKSLKNIERLKGSTKVCLRSTKVCLQWGSF